MFKHTGSYFLYKYAGCKECDDSGRMKFHRYVETLVGVLSTPQTVQLISKYGYDLDAGGSFNEPCPYCRPDEYYKDHDTTKH